MNVFSTSRHWRKLPKPWLDMSDSNWPKTKKFELQWNYLTNLVVFRKHRKTEKRRGFSWARKKKEISGFPSRAVRHFTKPHIFIARCTSSRLQNVRCHGRIWPLTCSAFIFPLSCEHLMDQCCCSARFQSTTMCKEQLRANIRLESSDTSPL